MKRILHITTDNKFISHALITFENVYPGQNTVWMFANGHDGHVSKNHRDLEFVFFDTFKPSFLKKLAEFDLVVVHGFDLFKYPLVALAPAGVKFAWLGWGYDYYDYIYANPDDLLLADTLALKNKCRQESLKQSIHPVKLIKKIARSAIEVLFRKRALKRIGSISPVLKEDYDLLKSAGLLKPLPDFLPWNYGSLEESLIKNFIGQRISGSKVLVGNSASFTNNHLEAFELLQQLGNSEQSQLQVIAPLSYGDDCCKQAVIEKGKAFFGDNFQPVTDFMPIDDYVALIKQCGFVVMNHKRQQAVGNIVIMLYLGARVFLREENPTYQMLKNTGAVINKVDELIAQPSLLKTPLTENEITNNIDVLYKHWSKAVIDQKTKNLVEFHLGALA
ncbi:TDP-N-acetylfucosamine:lipid II N-acetylfucosaminyltransferase [Thiomicrospira sp. ALE5]|uniref:TDP-N-acetylfucosamine:lipid II N-acetylfucosaminyltransferase n=1 Tax=Thiomicrospira sp. ALE5 TaxID=748650 RepID=UPI0008EBC4E4|nr:TDP-N-acetylfucosamine:lipid II N-acetylfucosaminyltransferase [Thiomicrospira sp. ALE5]SFR49270.1 4-alpha-L-fucosyltransferase glycosyl transferase group 56 [Thiomicrospira sp. ALE5]